MFNGIVTIKKTEILPFVATQMDLEIIMLNQVSQTETNYYMIALICGIYLQNRNRLTDIENKHSYQRGKQRRKGQITSLGLTDTH